MDILDDWSRWMKSDNHRLGFPNKSSYFSTGGESTSEVFQDMLEASDLQNVKIIDSIIDDLPQNLKQSIHYRFLGGKKPILYEKYFNQAMEKIHSKIINKIY